MSASVSDAKCDSSSAEHRNRGNELYKCGKHGDAAALYTHAIRLAVAGGGAAASAYGNRSAALYELDECAAADRDCRRALAIGGTDAQTTKWTHRAARLQHKLHNAPPVGNVQSQSDQPFHGYSSTVTGLSKAVGVEVTPTTGRRLVALQPLPAGSVLIVEQPYMQCAYGTASTASYCDQCCGRLPADPVPCAQCAAQQAAYCDERCARAAMAHCHWLECGAALADRVRAERGGGPHVAQLARQARKAIRFIAATGVGQLLHMATMTQDTQFVGTREHPFGCDARSSLSLVAHAIEDGDLLGQHRGSGGNAAPVSNWDTVCNAVIGALAHKAYFDEPQWPSDMDTDAKHRLVRAITKAVVERWKCNAMIVDTFEHDGSPLVLGGGLYPVAALMNHSCVPNVCRSLRATALAGGDGSKCAVLSVRTTRHIDAGEELFNNYGPVYLSMSRAQRQSALRRQYHFDCACTACADAWYKCAELRAAAMRCALCEQLGGANAGGMVPVAPSGKHFKCIQCAAVCDRQLMAPAARRLHAALTALSKLSAGQSGTGGVPADGELAALHAAVSACAADLHGDHARLAAMRVAAGKLLAHKAHGTLKMDGVNMCTLGIEALKRLVPRAHEHLLITELAEALWASCQVREARTAAAVDFEGYLRSALRRSIVKYDGDTQRQWFDCWFGKADGAMLHALVAGGSDERISNGVAAVCN